MPAAQPAHHAGGDIWIRQVHHCWRYDQDPRLRAHARIAVIDARQMCAQRTTGQGHPPARSQPARQDGRRNEASWKCFANCRDYEACQQWLSVNRDEGMIRVQSSKGKVRRCPAWRGGGGGLCCKYVTDHRSTPATKSQGVTMLIGVSSALPLTSPSKRCEWEAHLSLIL